MQEIVLPSSPNWFLSSVSSGNDSGLYAFGAKNQVFVYDLSQKYNGAHQSHIEDQETDNKSIFLPKFVACYAEHTEKISSVSLAPDSDHWICCSADEFSVKLWDIRSLVTIQMHNEHKGKIMCMTWSTCNSDLLLTADDKGTVVIWNLKTNFVKPFCLEKDMVCSIKASPHSGSQFAIGYKTGIALIIDIAKSYPVTLQRLRGHEAEITSISWCPIKGENFLNGSGDADDGALIATAGRKTIKIWSSTKGKEILCRKLPHSSTSRYDPHDPAGKRLWMDIHWPRSMPHHLISTSTGPQGDLYLLDIRKPSEQNLEKFIARHVSKHTKSIFNITGVGDKLCTFSMDRIITVWSLSLREALCSMCSFGGYLYCIKSSPLDPGRIAIGAGDNTIRIWNQSNKSNLFDISNLFYGIRSKITSVAWHPEKEGLLAYGTDDGRVGVYNTLVSSKPPTMSSTFHNKTVYVVCWGPPLNADSAGYQLYSVGDGVILQHFIGDPGKNALNIVSSIESVNKPQKEKLIRSEMSWKPDYTAFAVGHDNGCVSIYQYPNLKEVCQVTASRKLINCTKWHPDTTVESPGGSPCQNWLAFAGNDGPISVVDLSGIFATRNVPGKSELVKMTEVSCQVSGHIPRTTDMCWSPHHDGRLVSVGYDNVAIVWNMRTSEAMAVFNGHEGRLLTVLWCSIDSDIIMTGGFDGTLRMWRVSQQAGTLPSIADRKKKKKKSGGNPIMASSTSSKQEKTTATEQEIQELQDLLMMKRQVLSQIEKSCDGALLTNGHNVEGRDTPLESDVQSDEDTISSRHQLGDNLAVSPPVADPERPICSLSDECDEEGGTSRCGVPSASEIVPPVRPLFPKPKVPVSQSSISKTSQGGTTTDIAAVSDDKTRKRKQKPKSLFPVSSAANNRGKVSQQEDILDLTKLVTGQGSADLVDSKPHLGIFTDRLGAHRCLLQESEYHLKHDNMEYHLQLELWRGNIAGAVQIARQRNELSDWIVAMAPLASHDLWELVSAEYAEQLEEDGQYHKAATYLLAAHKVHQAIDLFRRHRLFREAVSLARMRLSPVDPMLEDLYTEWGQNLMKDGQFEQAAKCYLAMRHIQEAGKVLTRRSDQSSLKTACHMTLLANEKQQGLSYAYKMFTQNLVMGEWQEAYKFLGEHPSLKVLLPLLSTHELLIQHLSVMCPNLCLTQKPVKPEHFSHWDKSKETKGKASLPEFLVDRSDIDPVVPWEPYLIGEHTFPHHLLRIWHQHLDITMVTQELKAMHTAISQLISLRQNLGDLPSLMILVSMDVTLSLLVLLTSETSSAIIHLLQAMSTLYSSSHRSLLQALCRLMLPQGPKYLLKLQQEFNASRVLITMESHGDVDKAGGEGHNTIKKFLTDIKEDGAISSSNLRCRDLDCLRAYYYLAVLNFLRESFPSTQQEEDILDGMPNGMIEKVFSLSNCQDKDTLPVNYQDKDTLHVNYQFKDILPVETSQINSEDCWVEKDKAQSLSGGKNFLDQNGKIYQDFNSPSISDIFTTLDSAKSNSAEHGHRSHDLINGGVASNDKTSPKSPITSVLSTAGFKKSSSESSSVDPPFVPSSVSQQKPQLSSIKTASSPSQRSLSPSAPVIATGDDLAKASSSGANIQIKSSTLESKDTPNSIQTPRGHLSYPNLLRLSKGILWDIQAKREALTETLGYIHSAISQHLLANRQAETCLTSSTATLSPTSNASSYIPAMDGELEADGCCHQSRYFTLPSPSQPLSSPSQPLSSPSQPLSSPLLNNANNSSKVVIRTETDTKKGTVASALGETSKDILGSLGIERTRSLSPPPAMKQGDVTLSRGPFRSKSETCTASLSPTNPSSSKMDSAVSLHVEQDLLGNFDGNPIAFQKSRKVLWLDGKGRSTDQSPTSPKPVFNISRLAPDGSTIPVEWDDLPVDIKYTQPYMTLPLLKQEQDLVTQELRRVPDASKVPFPGTNISIRRLLDTCLNSPHLTKGEKLSYFKQLKDWAVLFAVTTHQQLETESYFSAAAVEYFSDSSCSC